MLRINKLIEKPIIFSTYQQIPLKKDYSFIFVKIFIKHIFFLTNDKREHYNKATGTKNQL